MTKRRRPDAGRFYQLALDRSDAALVDLAHRVTGLDQEIALLRHQVLQALADEDPDILARMMDLLIRAVRARYHLNHEAGEALGEHVAALLRQMESLIQVPPDNQTGDRT